MGHQLTRAAVAAALTLTAACGGGDDGGQPSALDVARQQVVVSGEGGEASEESSDAPGELPAPDPSLFVGANRVVNIWVDPDGEGEPLDVWGRRTFTTGPVLLVSDLGLGEVSRYFGAPPGYDLVLVGAGAGPDGSELAGLVNTESGEQVTTVVASADDGSFEVSNVWERDPSGAFGAPAPPSNGRGLVALYAPATPSFREVLGGAHDGLLVGDGSGACRRQRIEDDGFRPRILGGAERVEVELRPGPTTLSLHPSSAGCDQQALAELEVDVGADEVLLVVVYSVDGNTLDTLVLPA